MARPLLLILYIKHNFIRYKNDRKKSNEIKLNAKHFILKLIIRIIIIMISEIWLCSLNANNSYIYFLTVYSFTKEFLEFSSDHPNITVVTFAYSNIQRKLQQFRIIS